MSARLLRKLSFIVLCFAAMRLSAQSPASSPSADPRLLNHYSQEELNEMEKNDITKFNTVVYYYTRSYTVENIDCNGCTPRDTAAFDISEFEHFRKANERVVMTYKKYGIRLTLFSVDELKYKLPTQGTER